MSRHLSTLFRLLVALTAIAACKSSTADLGMTDSTFVQVMSELKVIADTPTLTDAVRAQRRDAVFRKLKVTATQIETLGPTLTAHPQHARRLWAAIDVKAEKLRTPVKK
jgi:hypothetical protein